MIERTKMRKDVYLVSKYSQYGKARVEGARAGSSRATSMAVSERLRTDYVDCYYIHGISSGDAACRILREPGVKAAFKKMKKAGKVRFAGLSCHDARLPEILEAAAEVGWIDQVMIKYNFRDVGGKDRYDD